MIGKNTILLNQASMQEAVQEWIAKRYTKDTPIVTHVKGTGATKQGSSIQMNDVTEFAVLLDGPSKIDNLPELNQR